MLVLVLSAAIAAFLRCCLQKYEGLRLLWVRGVEWEGEVLGAEWKCEVDICVW